MGVSDHLLAPAILTRKPSNTRIPEGGYGQSGYRVKWRVSCSCQESHHEYSIVHSVTSSLYQLVIPNVRCSFFKLSKKLIYYTLLFSSGTSFLSSKNPNFSAKYLRIMSIAPSSSLLRRRWALDEVTLSAPNEDSPFSLLSSAHIKTYRI
jgi:hypothetical protein